MADKLLFPANPPVAVPIATEGSFFPVRRVFCVGRNYAAHAREMSVDPQREAPFFFTKFPDTVVRSGGAVPYPPMTEQLQFEGELVIAIGAAAANLAPADAWSVIYGYAAGLDLTRRDLQLQARAQGRPWDMGKNFSGAAPVGAIHPSTTTGHLTRGTLRLTVNGETRQQADLRELIWNCAEIIAHLSRYDRLAAGDLIYTGTPAGVGPVGPGDVLEVSIEGLSPLVVSIGERLPLLQ